MTRCEIRILAVASAAVICLAMTRCSTNSSPTTPPPPSGPAISKVGVSCPFKVTASDTDYDRVSVRVDWDNGDTSDWSDLFRSGDTMTLTYVWPAAGDFRVSAQARDEKGAVSGWSNWHAIAIADTVNVPPGIPSTPSGPDTGYFHLTYEFSASAGDPNGDSVQLQFGWGDGDTSDWSRTVRESASVTMPHSWFQVGEYSVIARARDQEGLISEWSNVHIMVVIEDSTDLPPGIPLVPVGPDTGFVDSMYEFSTAGADPDGDSVLFQFDWGDGDTSAWSTPVAESTEVGMIHSWTSAGQFPVRARAMDIKGLMSDWSASHVLTVRDSLK
ncbi:PKD domain-containing protein [candidate division WOR-3 bacterium]|nr:PKD domain-containing protein [candidate division WOR-3 bacterium]